MKTRKAQHGYGAFLLEGLPAHNYIAEFVECLAQHFKITTSGPIVFLIQMDCISFVSEAAEVSMHSYYTNGILKRDFLKNIWGL